MDGKRQKLKRKILSDIIAGYQKRVVNLKKYRRIIPYFCVVGLLIVLVVFAFFIYDFFVRAETANFYPSSCLGGWKNPQNAQGEPDFFKSDFADFNEENSAFYDGQTSSQIFCGNFLTPQKVNEMDDTLKKVNLNLSWKIIPRKKINLIVENFESQAPEILEVNQGQPADFVLSSSSLSELMSTEPVEPAGPSKSDAESIEAESEPINSDIEPIRMTIISIAPDTELTQLIEPDAESAEVDIAPTAPDTELTEPDTENIADLDKISSSSETIIPDSTLENFLEISYSFDGEEWQVLGAINQDNWNSASFELPVASWEDLKTIQLKISNLPVINEMPLIYLDGMWLEAEYEEPSILAVFEDEKDLEDLPKVEIEEDIVFPGTKDVFAPNEEPTFEISPNLEEPISTSSPSSFLRNFFQKIFSFQRADAKSIRVIKAEIFNVENGKINFEPILDSQSGKISVRIPKIYYFKPGKYILKVELTDGKKIFLSSKEFEWGVLAINFNKSIYKPREIIQSGIAVLDKNGHTICDAKINLFISLPSEEVVNFSTEDGSIEKSSECGPNTITNKPDYYFTYLTSEIGIYKIQLKAQTTEGEKEISDSFEVREKVPFSIERKGPIRIWPLADYQMRIIIKSYEDYSGIIKEIIPSVFEILEINGDYLSYNIKRGGFSAKVIDLEVNFEADKTYIIDYKFDAPDISPEFYLLGPLQFTNFKEIRQWQIASDAVSNGATIVYGDSLDDGNLNFRNYTAPSTLGSELTTVGTSASDIAFIKIAAAPTREEKIVVHQKIDGRMDILTCTSGCDAAADWTLRATLSTLITTVDAMPIKRRPFDVAYEQLSGRAIIVFSEASTNGKVYYCIWDGNSWSPSSNCGATITPGAGNEISLTFSDKIAWVRLVPRGERLTPYRNNELLFGVAGQGQQLHLGRWTGSSWIDGINPTNALTSLDGQIFDMAWEEVSGRGLAIWDATTSATNLQFSIYSSGSGWGGVQTGPAKANLGIWKWVEAASNPNGNEISVITGNDLSDAEPYIWNGSSWTTGPKDLTAESFVGKHLDTKWTRFTNRALYLWTDTNALTSDMICWTSTGFSSVVADVGSPNVINTNDVEDVFLAPSPNNNEMLMTRHDIADDLKLLRYSAVNGCTDTDWTAIGTVLNGKVEGISGNTTRLPHAVAYTPYSPWSRNWRWTSDMTNLTPATWLAAENTAPTEISSGQNLRLRINAAEVTNQGQTDARKKLQYSTSSSETANWIDVDAQSGTSIWRYCDGPGTDDALMPTAVLTGSNAVGPFIENGTAASTYDHTALSVAEWDGCVQNNGANQATTYYFRLWDNTQQSPVFRQQTPGTSYTYPSLTTTGVTITVTLDSNTANFGNVAPGTPVATSTAITVETANSSGFNIKVNRDDSDTAIDLDTDALTNIADRTAWNSSSSNATVWISTDKNLGFRANQSGTDSGNYNSIWWGIDDTDANAKFAGFPAAAAIDTIVNRLTASSPPTNSKIKYKIDVENSQKTGAYSGSITYTITVNP